MATKADFTEDEWKTMQKGVTGAGMLVSAGDRDFTDSFGEAGALAKYLGAQREDSESPFIRELAAIRGSGFGFPPRSRRSRPRRSSLFTAQPRFSLRRPRTRSGAYGELVLGAAAAVADAKGGVKPGETAAIDAVREAVG